MEFTATVSHQGDADAFDSSALLSRQVRTWTEMGYQFRKWERKVILLGDPSPKVQDQHRRTLKMILRWTRIMHAMIEDVELEKAVRAQLTGLLLQLESSWRMIYEPMPDDKADKLLTEVFPDEPGT